MCHFFSEQPRNYTEYGYGRRGSSVKYGRRNDNRSNTGKNFQGSFQGPITSSKPFPKNNQQKFSNNQGGNANYDSSTPIKENGGKSYQHQHGQHGSKRDQPNVDNDISNGNSQHFGFHVPPFPYFGDAPEQHYGPPGHGTQHLFFVLLKRFYHLVLSFITAYPRMTPPVSGRSSSASVATPGQYFATNQVHGVSAALHILKWFKILLNVHFSFISELHNANSTTTWYATASTSTTTTSTKPVTEHELGI